MTKQWSLMKNDEFQTYPEVNCKRSDLLSYCCFGPLCLSVRISRSSYITITGSSPVYLNNNVLLPVSLLSHHLFLPTL